MPRIAGTRPDALHEPMDPRPADSLNIALAQLNPTVGDVAGNADKVRRARDQAAAQGADLVAFPELFIAGYPPEDLVLKPAFQAACRTAVEALARESTNGPAVLVGTPWVEDGKLYNAYVLLDGGVIEAVRFKVDLPNYGVFDEKRVFEPGPMPGPILVKGVRIGIPICEDIWGPEVVECLSETGGEILLVPNGSPYWRGKTEHRLNIAVARVVEFRPAADLSQHGRRPGRAGVRRRVVRAQRRPQRRRAASGVPRRRGADAMAARGRRLAMRRRAGGRAGPEGDKADYAACVLGLRDYVDKNGFKGVVLGLSGGIDSALCAAMAVDALGADRVRCVMLPYRFTSQDSLDDAARIAKALGVSYDILPIEPAVLGLEKALAPVFAGQQRDVTEENLQARARGTILMAISNKFGLMVVTTGNKSEMSVGYATLYGDMNGGFNPIKDLYKTEVFRLSRLRNVVEAGRRARRPAARSSRRTSSTSRRPRSCARTRRTRTRCRLTTCSTRSWSGWSSARSRSPRSSRRASTATPWCGSSACSISPNTSAGRRRRA